MIERPKVERFDFSHEYEDVEPLGSCDEKHPRPKLTFDELMGKIKKKQLEKQLNTIWVKSPAREELNELIRSELITIAAFNSAKLKIEYQEDRFEYRYWLDFDFLILRADEVKRGLTHAISLLEDVQFISSNNTCCLSGSFPIATELQKSGNTESLFTER